ncbi:MAG: FkbM family methyltransferase [Bacteroidota bacterium]|nr:FkbM family methyltransferase [Bacteroidota bacterium]
MKGLIKNILDSLGYSVLKKSTLQQYKRKLDPYKVQEDLMADKKDLCIFDVGAHYGETAIKYKNVFPNANIYSFEPFVTSAQAFLENTKEYSQIKLFKHAFSDKVGESEFYINSSDATNSLLASTITNSWVDNATKNSNIEKVKIDTIDNFCEKENINRVDILKLDVQGGEMLVLKGADRMLSSAKVKMIFTEVEFIEIYKNQPLFHDITAYLTRYNYKLFGLFDTHWLENGQIAWCDAVYIKAD